MVAPGIRTRQFMRRRASRARTTWRIRAGVRARCGQCPQAADRQARAVPAVLRPDGSTHSAWRRRCAEMSRAMRVDRAWRQIGEPHGRTLRRGSKYPGDADGHRDGGAARSPAWSAAECGKCGSRRLLLRLLAGIVEAEHAAFLVIRKGLAVARGRDHGAQGLLGHLLGHLVLELVAKAARRRAMA